MLKETFFKQDLRIGIRSVESYVNDNLREQLKYENKELVKRELYLYKDDLEIHYLHLDKDNLVVLEKETMYNEKGEIELEKTHVKNGCVVLEQHIYKEDGNLEEFKFLGYKDDIRLLIDPELNAILQISGSVDYVGDVTIRLEQIVLN